MVHPSGNQFEIVGGGYRAVVTESGATLRGLWHGDRPLLDGFASDAMASIGRGQLLMPWPNRIRDGRYSFAGRCEQLPLSEPARHNASQGLVRWVSWSVVEHRPAWVTLGYRLPAQPGYPWTLDLQVRYQVSEHGMTVTQTAVNRSASAAPYAQGAHPYLTVGDGPVDRWELTLPASTRLLCDSDRKLPISREDVTGTAFDFRSAREVSATVLEHGFTDLVRDESGRCTVTVRNRLTGWGAALWVDETHPWVIVYSVDDQPTERPRGALAIEPMTAPPDAFNSGEDLVVLKPGERFSGAWGLCRVDELGV